MLFFLRKKEEERKKTYISFNFGGQVVSVVSGLDLEKQRKEEEEEKEEKEKRPKKYDSDSDSDSDNDNDNSVSNGGDVAASTIASTTSSSTTAATTTKPSESSGENGVCGDAEETEFIGNEEFCPIKPKDVPFGVAANLSIAAPVYHKSAQAKDSSNGRKDLLHKTDDPFNDIDKENHPNRVQHDYFAD